MVRSGGARELIAKNRRKPGDSHVVYVTTSDEPLLSN